VDQLTAASVSVGGNVVDTFSYSYDQTGNRVTEQINAKIRRFSYNALNELTSIEADVGPATTYQWDAEHRLVDVSSGNQNTQFTYDGLGRLVGIRLLVNGVAVSDRRFVWCDNSIAEERTPGGIVSKRFFDQGVKVETGDHAGAYFYTRDHLGSIRELTDSGGDVRARYSYDPFGQGIRLTGDLDVDFGFAGMFWTLEASLNLTRFRAYAPNIGRWLSRDPLENAERIEGPNLFTYVHNNPVNNTDLLGLNDCQWGGPEGYFLACWDLSKPRDCETEEQDCKQRRILICGLATIAMTKRAKNKPVFRPDSKYRLDRALEGTEGGILGIICQSLYEKACFRDKRSCQRWNKRHGF
jgi:RHS repeat-associated protein